LESAPSAKTPPILYNIWIYQYIYIIYIYIYHISGTILAEKQIKMMNNEEEHFAKCLLEPSLKQDDHGEQTGNGNGMTFSSICQIDVRRCTKDAPDSQELPRDCQLEVIVIGNFLRP